MTFASLASTTYHDLMPPRPQVTASALRQGIGTLITELMQGHEIVLTYQGSPIGIIRPWTKDDAADEDGPAPPTPLERKTKGEQSWRAESVYPTRHLKPTFSDPEK